MENKEEETKPVEAPENKEEDAKKEQKKRDKKKEKADKKKSKQERKDKKAQEEVYVKDPNDPCASKFGDMELIVSKCNPEEAFKIVYTPIANLTEELDGKTVKVRARLHNSRIKGKMGFLVLRESFNTVQAIMSINPDVSQGMIKYAKSIPKESLLEVVGVVKKPGTDITGCTQKVELDLKEIWTASKCIPVLPFQLEDAMRKVLDQEEEEKEDKEPDAKEKKDKKDKKSKKDKEKKEEKETEEEKGKEERKDIHVSQVIRLDNRVLDLRVPANQALMIIQSNVGRYFREFLYNHDFVEIHSPKINPGVSEGGTEVFKLKYFNQDACLAQSPQLYKQMGICGDLTRVFEIAPVFRAENSNTNRHLCEFTMMDVEMAFKNHYFEVMDLLGEMFNYIFDKIHKNCVKELAVVNEQYPFEPFVWKTPAVKLEFTEGVKLLNEAGIKQDPNADLNSESEKALGAIIKEKFGTDFYMLYRFPVGARPFYTMTDPNDPKYTNSYDFFMRGEEIVSGAQRIHEPTLLSKRASDAGIPLDSIKGYIDSFRYGAPPHAGCGIGLERIVKLICGIRNIRKCIMFTRDPKRLAP